MRTLINLSLTLVIILFAQALSYSAILGEENYSRNSSINKSHVLVKKNKHFVHNTTLNGELIPVIILPEVTIRAERNTKNILQVIRKANILIAVVDLPEVVITGEKKTSGYKLKFLVTNHGITPVVDLPEVVISAESANIKSFAWKRTNENNTPVVNLPEVVVAADFPESNKVLAILYKGNFIAAVNLPVVEITAKRPEGFMVSNELERTYSDDGFKQVELEKAGSKTSQNFNELVFLISRMILFNLL